MYHEQERRKLIQKQYESRIKNIISAQNVYKNLSVDWDSIDKEVESLALEYNAKKPTIYNRIKGVITDIRYHTDNQFIDLVKDTLTIDGYTGNLDKLKKKELLLLGFCYMKCSKAEIAKLINIPIQKVHPQKLSLKHKLIDAQIPIEKIERLLFY